jgi:hypothetical protein
LIVGFPSALPTGLARGVGAGWQHGVGLLTWGARAGLTTTSESSEAWGITHHDVRLRITGSVQHAAGRGTFALRAAVGAAIVREARTRHQGMRAGLSDDEVYQTAYALLPIGTLDGVLALRVRGPWSLQLAAGPSITLLDGSARAGWSAELGVGWQP